MREVSREVVRTELMGRVKPVFNQVIGPGGQHLPVVSRVIGLPLYRRDGCRQDQHVTRLLHRHICPVGLPVRDGIGSHVVRGEGFGPPPALAVIEDVVEQPFRQLRVIDQKQRR